MECLKDFLCDTYQSRLRIFAQGKSERYEETIENYRQIFIAHLVLVKEEYAGCKDCQMQMVCSKVREVVKRITEEEINDFFYSLKKIYLDWINSKIIESIKQFETLLTEYELFQFEKEIKESDVFFKARISSQVLNKFDMFHIPFNKRYLIENQRYSITGQPMLYIGSSIIGVAEEIGLNTIEDFKISIVRLPANKFKIYDLRNNTINDFESLWIDIMLDWDYYSYTKAHFCRAFRMYNKSIPVLSLYKQKP